jgi:hypothetical protein
MKRIFIILLFAQSTLVYANDEAIGCYVVQVASPSGKVEAKSLQLTSEPANPPWGVAGGMRVLPANPKDKFNYSAVYWVRENGSVVVTFSNNGLSGVQIRARESGSGFQGTIEHFWDTEPSVTESHKVVLARQPCNSFR